MKTSVVVWVCGLVAEEIPVCPGLKEALVAGPAPLPQGESQGTVGPPGLDLLDERAENLIGEVAVLPPLKDKGAKAQGIALLAAVQNVLGGQAVAVTVRVAFANAAVEAVVFAQIADFNEAAGIDLVAIDFLAQGPPLPPPAGWQLWSRPAEKGLILLQGQAMVRRRTGR